MTQILVDRIGRMSFHNGLVRVECQAVGPDGKTDISATLLLPGTEAGKTLASLVKSLQELQKKVAAKGSAGRA
jgi:hypothetical protein